MKKIFLSLCVVFALVSQTFAQKEERDEIYSLVPYSIVLKDWQTEKDVPGRGHNIGAILVNPNDEIVFGDLNCNFISKNTTQHAEVRNITKFLKESKTSNLSGYTIYTTLEPCAMCSGMMTQSQVKRVVYGQTDPLFGKALERLQLDSRKLKNGFPPYPRPVLSEPSMGLIRIRLDGAYEVHLKNTGITEWLRSVEAREIYVLASERLVNYKCIWVENEIKLKDAKAFVEKFKVDTGK